MDRWKKANLSKALFSAQKSKPLPIFDPAREGTLMVDFVSCLIPVTPEFLASQGKRKAALLKTLSRAIKEVSRSFSRKRI